jgi:TatD DNase family protein
MDHGFMVSFAGNITFKKADDLRAVARVIPLDRLLSETDCPYLAPVPYRGKRNEPAYVREVTSALAALHNISEDEMGRQLVANFVRFFGLDDAD